jgi:hypothetical protein
VSIVEYVRPGIPTSNVDNAQQNIYDDATLKKVLTEIQNFRKDIQLWRSEHTELAEKVDRMEEKVNIIEGKLNVHEGKKGNEGFVSTKQQPTPTPTPTPTPISDDDHGGLPKDVAFIVDDDDDAADHTSIPSLLDEV